MAYKVNEKITVKGIISNHLFESFGQFILSTDYRVFDNLSLSQITYHSHIKTDTTIQIINYIRHNVRSYHTFFYDSYSDKEKENNSVKRVKSYSYLREIPMF